MSATYQLVNAAEEQQLDLVFVTGAAAEHGFTVTIDGKAIGAMLLALIVWPVGAVLVKAAWRRHRPPP